MSKGYVVTAPYITVRVKDDLGSDVIQGFYKGGVLPEGVHQDDLDRHVRKGMVAEPGTPEADAATPFGESVRFDAGGVPMSPADVAAADAKKRPAARPTDPKARPAEAKG